MSAVQTTLGSLEVGAFIFIFLFGVATLQSWIYYERFPNDKAGLKIMVAALWFLNLGQGLCDAYAIYYMTVTEYGQLGELSELPPSIGNVPFILTGMIGLIVQSYYAIRIHDLTRKLWLPVFCWVTSLAMFVMAVYNTIQALHFTDGANSKEHIIIAPWILAALIDIIITVSLCWYFFQQKNSVLGKTNMVLDTLIKWTIRTGLVTSVTAITVIIAYEAMPTNFVWLAISTPLAALYVNSLYAMLNARITLRSRFDGSDRGHITVHLDTQPAR